MGAQGADTGKGEDSIGEPIKSVNAHSPAQSTQTAATKGSAPVLASGWGVGVRTASGIGRFVASAKDLDDFRPGEILLADFTLPEWQSAMSMAAAIVTNKGGRTSNAAIAARRFGVPAVVGTIDGASRLWTGAILTVTCARGGVGRVYEGVPPADTMASAGDRYRSKSARPFPGRRPKD